MTLLKLAEEVLRREAKALTAREIWDLKAKHHLEYHTNGLTPWASIAANIGTDIKDNPNTLFYKPEAGKFALNEFASGSIVQEVPIVQSVYKKATFNERDLHPLLAVYARESNHFKAYLKTIYHENSSKGTKGEFEWLHPDMVGVYFPFEDYQSDVLKLQRHLSVTSVKLFSFELKKELNMGNLRESYFQAVSNSDWANEGYLVALKIDDKPEFMDELRRLNNSKGIGIIQLDAQDINNSKIIFYSKLLNPEVNWDTINRLSERNKDFRKFITDVGEDCEVKNVKSKYDEVLKGDKLQAYIKEKGIY